MTTAEWVLLGPAACYTGAAILYGARGEWGWAIAYLAYATANVGLISAAVAGR